jgi:murein DD-endopeptidase MepM/ murein hydrolase activator NlpD
MKIADLLKRMADAMLPTKHQLALVGLGSGLVLIMLVSAVVSVNSQAGRNGNGITTSNQPSSATSNNDAQASISTDSLTPKPPLQIGPLTEKDPRLVIKVGEGDNLSLLFNRAGLGAQDVQSLAASEPANSKLAQLYPNDQLAFSIAADNTLASLEIIRSPLESFLYTRDEAGNYHFSHLINQPTIELVQKEAVITDSLFQAAQRGGIPAAMAMELAGIFGGVVDFILDTREGDSFNLVYEEKYLDGEFIGFGRILAAQFTNQGEMHTAVRYENEIGESNFFNLEGESMRKSFLLNPVDFTRISSGFSLARKHPILNTIRAHKGTDYAAPTGTQVVATADGRITFANRKGTFGKLVVIQHDDQFETRYAHLNDFARGISNGVRVRQGQVIGYVGSTGGATGPHLHYEFLMDGVQRNPRTIEEHLPRASSVAESELPRFKQQARGMLALLENKGRQRNTIARNSLATPEE